MDNWDSSAVTWVGEGRGPLRRETLPLLQLCSSATGRLGLWKQKLRAGMSSGSPPGSSYSYLDSDGSSWPLEKLGNPPGLTAPSCSGRSSSSCPPFSHCLSYRDSLDWQDQRGGSRSAGLLVLSYIQIIKRNEVGFYPRKKKVAGEERECRNWVLIGWLAFWRRGPYLADVTHCPTPVHLPVDGNGPTPSLVATCAPR